jgi:hypothetical protein
MTATIAGIRTDHRITLGFTVRGTLTDIILAMRPTTIAMVTWLIRMAITWIVTGTTSIGAAAIAIIAARLSFRPRFRAVFRNNDHTR